jgi:uncharacterized membrane-anchored protein YjiN (DUF445 family)
VLTRSADVAAPLTPLPDEVERRAGLRRMKAMATALLVGAGVVFVVTRTLEDSVTWLGPVRATAEAAMVGALADWFAVTALFRHPLGIPIPHTAIIPANKDRIGRTLGNFVRQNFLSPTLVSARVRDAKLAQRAGAWLAEPVNAARAAETLGTVLAGLPNVLDDEEISTAIRTAVTDRVRTMPAAPLLARGLEVAIAEGHHRALVDAVLARAGEYIDDNREVFRQRLRSESPRWVPGRLDDIVFGRIFGGAKRLIVDLAANPEHELRRDIDARLFELVGRLRTDPELAARVEARKEELLDHPDLQGWAASVWAELKEYLVQAARDPNSTLRSRFEHALTTAGARLRDDPSLQASVDGSLTDAAASIASQYGEGAADYIAATVERWNPADTSDRLELVVGRDLQFIRINGTVVGGLAGLVIYLLGNML